MNRLDGTLPGGLDRRRVLDALAVVVLGFGFTLLMRWLIGGGALDWVAATVVAVIAGVSRWLTTGREARRRQVTVERREARHATRRRR